MAETKPLPELTANDIHRFWNKVAITANPNECWYWLSSIRDKKKPYGRFSFKRRLVAAHRISYLINTKSDPQELHVLHTCDNHRCVNPNHLFLGTNADNVADKVKKGRQSKTEAWCKGIETKYRLWDNKNCKPNKPQFEKMKELYEKGGISIKELAQKYNTSKKAVSKGIRKLGGFVPIHTTILSANSVKEIRAKYIKNDYPTRRLAREYNIGQKTILDIIHRKTWKDI